MSQRRRFAPMGLWMLPGCGKLWTASKPSKHAPAHFFPRALGKPAYGRRLSTATTGRTGGVKPPEEGTPQSSP